jgi:mannose-1-phosphate guanylyltransferase
MPAAVKAMILCAGFGTRLRPLTELWPKPAVPVAGAPLVHWTARRLARGGVRALVVNTHHLAEKMERALLDVPLPVEVSREEVILGTGGGVYRAFNRELLGEGTLFVLNGDVLFAFDPVRALAAHRASGALVTLVVQPARKGYGTLAADREGRLAGFGDSPGEKIHFTGVHVVEPAALETLPPGPSDILRDAWVPLARRTGRVFVHRDEAYWDDVGTPAGYLKVNLEALEGRVPMERPPALPGTIEAGAEIVRSCVCAGARVRAGARLEDSVVLDGTTIEPGEHLQRVIAAGTLRITA